MELIPAVLLALAGLGTAALGNRAAGNTKDILQAAANAILGLAALLAVNQTAAYTGVHLGFNLFNALVVGVLGVPGLILLVLAQWVLS